jgi:filamentous hemagglutinin
MNTDTLHAQNGASTLDVDGLERSTQAEQEIKALTITEAGKVTDESYHVLFEEKAKLGRAEIDKEGNSKIKELSDEEKENLTASADGKVHIATNGIFNDEDSAAGYANQHTTSDGNQYIVDFPKADNVLSELLVAGYQKYLEGDILGLSNATEAIKEDMNKYGQTGLELDGHSRGSMTIGNALESKIKEDNAQGSLSDTTITFFGPAYNAKKADDLLSVLQNRSAMDKATQVGEVLKLQNHIADPVGGLIGGNPTTGGTIPEGSSMLQEMLRAATGQQNTSHNCYGAGNKSGMCENFWKDSPIQRPISQPVVIIKSIQAKE